MADYFFIAELIKYETLNNSGLMIHNSFTYKTKIKTETVLDSYFISVFGAEDTTPKQALNIKGCRVDLVNSYAQVTSETDCEDNEESFYFDIENQMLYIHLEHSTNPYNAVIEFGKVIGMTNDKIRNFNGIDYLPYIKSIPNLKLKVDPLKYARQSLYGGTIILNNQAVTGSDDGPFDSNDQFTGNDIIIYFGQDGDSYTDLKYFASNYIVNTKPSMNEIAVITRDKREQQSKNVPYETFTLADFPDIDPDLVGDIKPDGYGLLNSVPGICVNSEQTGNKTFYFCSSIKSSSPTPEFLKLEDEVWQSITPSSTDYANGMVTFAVADIHIDGSSSKGLFDVICNAVYVDISNPADIIADMNDRFLNITYNSSNYDTTEWADEKQYLEDIALYMDEPREIFEWIEFVQSGSTVGFQYLFENGKRTIRLDNPNRDYARTIQAVEILNNDTLSFDNNDDFFATHAVIQYDKNIYKDKFSRYENRDYYDSVFREHKKDSEFEVDCLLLTEGNAENKSIIILEDLKKERITGTLDFFGKDYYNLRLFDIIYVELSFPGYIWKQVEYDTYIDSWDSEDDIYIDSWDSEDDIYIDPFYTVETFRIGYREFLGWQRLQVIGIEPDTNEAGNISIEVRQRDYSNEYDTITGYTP